MFLTFLKEIIHSVDYYSLLGLKIVILSNFHTCKYSLQNVLRILIEKYRKTTLFIIVTDSYTGVIEPIRSRTLGLRIPGLTNKEKLSILWDFLV